MSTRRDVRGREYRILGVRGRDHNLCIPHGIGGRIGNGHERPEILGELFTLLPIAAPDPDFRDRPHR